MFLKKKYTKLLKLIGLKQEFEELVSLCDFNDNNVKDLSVEYLLFCYEESKILLDGINNSNYNAEKTLKNQLIFFVLFFSVIIGYLLKKEIILLDNELTFIYIIIIYNCFALVTIFYFLKTSFFIITGLPPNITVYAGLKYKKEEVENGYPKKAIIFLLESFDKAIVDATKKTQEMTKMIRLTRFLQFILMILIFIFITIYLINHLK